MIPSFLERFYWSCVDSTELYKIQFKTSFQFNVVNTELFFSNISPWLPYFGLLQVSAVYP
jgi:hypothetical protein